MKPEGFLSASKCRYAPCAVCSKALRVSASFAPLRSDVIVFQRRDAEDAKSRREDGETVICSELEGVH